MITKITKWTILDTVGLDMVFDPSTYLQPVELHLKKVSKFNNVLKIQQIRSVFKKSIEYRPRNGGSKFIIQRKMDKDVSYKLEWSSTRMLTSSIIALLNV